MNNGQDAKDLSRRRSMGQSFIELFLGEPKLFFPGVCNTDAVVQLRVVRAERQCVLEEAAGLGKGAGHFHVHIAQADIGVKVIRVGFDSALIMRLAQLPFAHFTIGGGEIVVAGGVLGQEFQRLIVGRGGLVVLPEFGVNDAEIGISLVIVRVEVDGGLQPFLCFAVALQLCQFHADGVLDPCLVR